METLPEPHFDLWIPAVQTGLLPLHRLITWADEQIMRLSEPPRWLLELSLSTSVDALERARKYEPEGIGRERFDPCRIHVGSMYLAVERGQMPMEKLLLEAGQLADYGAGDLPECEAFFVLLNEAEGRGFTRPSTRPLADRVRELFAPMVAEVRAALIDLPGGEADTPGGATGHTA